MQLIKVNFEGAFNAARYAYGHIRGLWDDSIIIVLPSTLPISEEELRKIADGVLVGVEYNIGHYLSMIKPNIFGEDSLCIEFPDCDYDTMRDRVYKLMLLTKETSATVKWTSRYELYIVKLDDDEVNNIGGAV